MKGTNEMELGIMNHLEKETVRLPFDLYDIVVCFFRLICLMYVALLLEIVLLQFVILNAYVPSGSMEGTIMTGDSILGIRMTCLPSELERGDIVLFRYPDEKTQTYIKRIIGLPGETVVIKDGKIYIDGSSVPLQEDYLPEVWTVGADSYTFEVPQGCYLMLGDNRNNSWDARYWENTYVEQEDIIAKAVLDYTTLCDIMLFEKVEY